MEGAGHPLLGAVVERPDSGGLVLTGRLSLAAQPWLADHSVGGVVLFPGAGFVELAIRAADEVGCAIIDELVLAAPLVVQPGAGVQVQVVVGAAGDVGGRAVSVYSRRDESDAEWLLHAEGMLGIAAAEASADLSVWPPVDAESVDISDGYARLAARGYGYGPAFQGLAAIWRRGPELFAEAAIPAEASVDGMGIHPALLDAVLTRHGACRRHHRNDVAVLLAGGVATRGRCRPGAGPLHRGGCGCDVDRGGRCCRVARLDGALAGDPPDDGRAVERRRDDGCRPSRLRTAGSGVVANPAEAQQH